MNRFARALRPAILGFLLALPIACMQAVETSRSELEVAAALLECPIGSEGCPCTNGGGCDPGLVCSGGYCVSTGYDFEDEEYLYTEDVMLDPPEAARPISKESPRKARGGKGAGKQRDKSARMDSPAAAADYGADTLVDSKTVAGVEVAPPEARDPADEEPQDARQVIYTAGLDVSVYDLEAAMTVAEAVPTRYGGWIESRYDWTITLRVPADRLFEVIDEMSALGVVLGKTLRADDVTAEFTDLESRILVLEQLVEQLEALLAKAKTVEEALKIRVELDRVRVELEAARVRMRQLSELIDFSTLTLMLTTRGPLDLPSSNDPFPWVDDLGVETTEYR